MIVVGGGIAGLYVARELASKGPVTVLEKYHMLGGRVHTGHVGSDSFELGAGRIHSSHKRVLSLVKEYGLKTIDIGGIPQWRPAGANISVENRFEPTWMALLTQIRKLSPEVLGSHTLRELSDKILGSSKKLLETFPYRTELESLRADLGIKTFDDTLGTQAHYSVVAGGLSQLIEGLAADIRKRGGVIHTGVTVTNVTNEGGKYIVHTNDKTFEGSKVILCVESEALRKLPVTRGLRTLQHLGMAPLIRIYAKYPPWFTGADRTVTDSPLRYIIPINPAAGVIMISYTDGRDTEAWKGLKGSALTKAIQKEVRALFPERKIPEPLWVKSYEWQGGTTFWKPGSYDPVAESQAILQPRPATMPGLYICGESFSLLQAWMEGSLEHAERLLKLI